MKIFWHLVMLVTASLSIFLGLLMTGLLHRVYASTTLPGQYVAPYQDITVGPTLQSVMQSTGQKYFTLAFITGHGCNAQWAGYIPLDQTTVYLPHLMSDINYIRSHGGDIIISFGGASGKELALACSRVSSLQQQYQRVINIYQANHLDFDIEGGTEGDATSYTRRNQALAALQKVNPGLSISFTLPSSTSGLLSKSLGLIRNAQANGVNISVINLMTMDYGPADSHMGQDAINAANGLYSQLGKIYTTKSASQLWSMVGITSMIGQNDSAGEVFTLSDAQKVLTFAEQNHLGELAMWEISRDNGNCAGSTQATDTCSGVAQSLYAYTNILQAFTSY